MLELTEDQLALLSVLANGGVSVFALVYPTKKDGDYKKKILTNNVKTVKMLIKEGLLVNITKEKAAYLRRYRELSPQDAHRKVQIIGITVAGKMMFEEYEEREIN